MLFRSQQAIVVDKKKENIGQEGSIQKKSTNVATKNAQANIHQKQL